MRTKTSLVWFVILVFFSCQYERKPKPKDWTIREKAIAFKEAGKKQYEDLCQHCHGKTNRKHFFLGDIVRNEAFSEAFLIDYIQNQDSLIKHKNKEAMHLKVEWGNQANTHNFPLDKREVQSILYYLKQE